MVFSKSMVRDWKKEVARDILALGSIVFFILVFARSLIGPFDILVFQLLFSGSVFILAALFFDNYDGYVSRALALTVFLSLFYRDNLFSVFAVLAFVGLIVSANYLGSARGRVFKGVIVGVIATVAGYYLAPLI